MVNELLTFSCWTGDVLFQAEVLDTARILVVQLRVSFKEVDVCIPSEYDGSCPDSVHISN